jgi:hypothetical protein
VTEERVPVGLVVARRKVEHAWITHRWIPIAVLPAPAEAAPWTRLPGDAGDESFYAGAFEIALHAGDTAHYRDNLASGRPAVWIALRPIEDDAVEVAALSVDPYEGEAMAETPGDVVEAVAMPDAVAARVAAFVAAHHVEREFFKRERRRADPEALARGRRAADDDE